MFFLNAKQGKNSLLRYLLGPIFIIFFYILGILPLFLIAPGSLETLADSGLSPNLTLFLALLSPIFALALFYYMFPRLHRRPFISLLTTRPKFDWKRIFFAAGLWFFLAGLLEFIFYLLSPENYALIFDLKTFVPLLFIAIFLIPLQTSFEEIVFRGYLMQGFGLLNRLAWLPLVNTSVLFGLLHLANPEVAKFGFYIMAIYYIGFGFVLGICTLMDDGLELSIGLHTANNIFAVLILTFEGSALPAPAIFQMQMMNPLGIVIGWLVASAVFIFIVAKKYDWKDWGKLYREIRYE